MNRPPISESDKLVIRVLMYFLAACVFLICAGGTANTLSLQTRGIHVQAQVLETQVDQRYRTVGVSPSVVLRFNEDYYRVKVQFLDQQGATQVQWTRISQDDKERFNVAVGSRVPFIYIPGGERSAVATAAPSWSEAIIWNAVGLPLGCFFIWLAIFKYR